MTQSSADNNDTHVCRLYLITPPKIDDLDGFASVFDEALAAGDVACVQLRLKNVADAQIEQAVSRLMPIARAHGAAFLMNDRPDLAVSLKTDGVHIGQDDGTYTEARDQVGADATVGVTCHNSRHLAMEAGEAGADYVAFGAFYATGTKEAKTQAKPDLLSWWSELFEIPCVAIGGITLQNCGPLVAAGADFLAVSSGVWDHHEGPAAAVAGFTQMFRG